MKLKPYPEYKTFSGSEVLKIPEHWRECRCRYLFREVDERSENGSETHLSMSQAHGLIESSKIDKWRLQSESYAGGKLCKQDDLVLNRLKAHLGVFAHANTCGVVSPDYTVLRPITKDSPRFFEFLFKSPLFITEFTKATKGIVKGFWRLYTNDFYAIRAIVPPCEEQYQILRFIDVLAVKINKFIRKKRRLIGLLKEQKQNIINRAVTRGLDPNVKLKPSGVEWLGDIPEHWETAPLKHLAKINNNVLYDSTDKNYTFKYLDISSVDTGFLVREPEIIRFGQAPSRARRILKKGDTIISTVRTYLKAVYHVATEIQDWIASTGFAVLTPNNTIYPSFLGLLIVSDCFINRVIQKSVGVAYPAISETQLGTLYLAYPASIDEQRKIWEAVSLSSKFLDQAIARAEREIELMTEYRARLISDVVTGKVDVRGIDVPQISEDELLTPDEETDVEDGLLEEETPEEEIEDADE